MRWSIRHQLLAPLALLLLGLAGVCTWTARESARLAKQRIADQVHGIIRTLSDAHFPLNRHVLEQMKGLSGAEYLLLEPTGESVATFPGRVGELPAAAPLNAESDAPLGDRIVVEGQAYLCRGVLLRPPHLNAGSRLYILYPESLRDEAVRQAVRPTLILGVSAGAAALLLTLYGAHRLVRRLRDLEQRTRQIAAGDFSPMPLPGRNDELRDLARSVNDMAARLAQLQDAVARSERVRLLGQVSGGLAHQMRNAVTGAKLAVQLHAQTCAAGDAEALEVAERQLSRMAADLQRFFELGREGARRSPCGLAELVGEAVSLLRPQCRHAHTELHWEPPADPCVIAGDEGQLGHLILNLIGNAAEAAGPSGHVDVRLVDRESKCILEVSDTGPGPPPGMAARLFEPFVTGKPEGIGLGLAVAKQVVEAHGGTISWARENNLTVFRVELPRARSAIRNPQSEIELP